MVQVQGVDEDELAQDDCGTLKVDCLPAVMAQRLDIQKSRVKKCGSLGQHPFKISKKRGIVQSPF